MADLIKEWKVRTPDGRSFNIKVPSHVSKEEAMAWAQAHMPPAQGALDQAPVVHAPGTEPGGIYDRLSQLVSKASGGLLESPKGFRGPGFLSNLGSAIQQKTRPQTLSGLVTGQAGPETPQQVYERTTPAFETAADIFGTIAMPGATVAGRMAGGIGVPAVIAALGGKDIMGGAMTGGTSQGVAEILMGIVKAGRLGHLATTARAEFDKKLAGRAADLARDTDRIKVLEGFETNRHSKLTDMLTQEHADLKAKMEGDYTRQVATRDDLMAGSIMDEAKKSVPAWKDIPSTVAGLYTAVLGKGKELLSDAFQTALDAAKETARGKTVHIPVEDAHALKVPVVESTTPLTARERFEARLNTPAQGSGDLRLLVPVDAAELIEKLPGFPKAAVKARAQQALFDADLGIDAAARAEYKVGKGTIEMVDENKLFTFDPVTREHSVNSDNLAKNILSREHMDTISNRGMGDFDTLPALEAAKLKIDQPAVPPLTLPEAPRARPALSQEPLLSPDETGAITSIPLPGNRYARSAAGSLIGGALGGLLGGGVTRGGVGGLTGGALGAILPDKLVTKAPMSETEAILFQLLPKLLGTAGRNIGASPASATGLDPDALAAMDAEIAAAAPESDPRLQLDVTPAE